MRLYLSSYRLGSRPERLAELVGKRRKAVVIANACDLDPEAERSRRVGREIAALGGLGFWAEELDLRRHFRPGGDREGLRARLASAGLVWARGGNAFVLLRAMRQSGLGVVLGEAPSAGEWVYGGYSGGIAVLPPTLRGIEKVNDPAAVPPGYTPETPWDALAILDFWLAPHYKSPHPSSPGIDTVVDYFRQRGMPFQTLTDGEVLILSGDKREVVG